jgi:hypothetical protein
MCELGEGRKKNYIADLVMDLILRVIRRREKPRKFQSVKLLNLGEIMVP